MLIEKWFVQLMSAAVQKTLRAAKSALRGLLLAGGMVAGGMVVGGMGLAFNVAAQPDTTTLEKAVLDAATRAYLSQTQGGPATLRLSSPRLRQLSQPALSAAVCDSGWQIGFDTAIDITRPLPFRASCDGGLALTGQAQVTLEQRLWVARRALLRGEPIDADALEQVWREVRSASAPVQPIGQQVKRRVREGQVISAALIESLPAVRRGQRVNVIAGDGAVSASLEGEVLADAALGERVRVRNLSSRKVLEGVLRDAQTVVVDL